MPKDSQLDPKEVREHKNKGQPTFAESGSDGEGRNRKKQSTKADSFQSNSRGKN